VRAVHLLRVPAESHPHTAYCPGVVDFFTTTIGWPREQHLPCSHPPPTRRRCPDVVVVTSVGYGCETGAIRRWRGWEMCQLLERRMHKRSVRVSPRWLQHQHQHQHHHGECHHTCVSGRAVLYHNRIDYVVRDHHHHHRCERERTNSVWLHCCNRWRPKRASQSACGIKRSVGSGCRARPIILQDCHSKSKANLGRSAPPNSIARSFVLSSQSCCPFTRLSQARCTVPVCENHGSPA
jgi:hypothetical protein